MAENKTINKEQNRTENNEIVIMNFSGIYKEQQFYRNHAEMQEDISWLEVQDLPGSNCYCDEEAKNRILDDIKNYTGNGIHFIDSGNYHYVSRLWLSKMEHPFRLLVYATAGLWRPFILWWMDCGIFGRSTDAARDNSCWTG